MQIQLFPLHYPAFYQLSDFFNSKTELKSTVKIFSLSSIAHVPHSTGDGFLREENITQNHPL